MQHNFITSITLFQIFFIHIDGHLWFLELPCHYPARVGNLAYRGAEMCLRSKLIFILHDSFKFFV